jgi:hypothetical protein
MFGRGESKSCIRQMPGKREFTQSRDARIRSYIYIEKTGPLGLSKVNSVYSRNRGKSDFMQSRDAKLSTKSDVPLQIGFCSE